MDSSDTNLVHRAQQGDRQAFASLIGVYYDRIYRSVYRFSGYIQDAEDIAQEVCMKIVDKLSTFRGESQFSTWIYALTLNTWRDFAKKQSHRRQREESYVALEFQKGDEKEVGQTVWLYRQIAQLPPELKETALLVLAEELSHAEAAKILECAESTVSWRLHQIRQLLKDKVEVSHV